jgi:hypothetical protein
MQSDFELLVGKDLDEFGIDHGILRYQGLSYPETDEQYRDQIRMFLNKNKRKDLLSKEIAADPYSYFGVGLFNDQDQVVKIVQDFNNSDQSAIFSCKEAAQREANKWLENYSGNDKRFRVIELRIFEK